MPKHRRALLFYNQNQNNLLHQNLCIQNIVRPFLWFVLPTQTYRFNMLFLGLYQTFDVMYIFQMYNINVINAQGWKCVVWQAIRVFPRCSWTVCVSSRTGSGTETKQPRSKKAKLPQRWAFLPFDTFTELVMFSFKHESCSIITRPKMVLSLVSNNWEYCFL